MQDFIDRRKESIPVQQERRLEERVAVLEIQVDNHATKLEDNQEMLIKFFDRFDRHLETQAETNKILNGTLIKVGSVVDNLSSELSKTNRTVTAFADRLDVTSKTVTTWDTIAKTIIKIAIVLATVLSGAWAVYNHITDYSLTPSTTKGK
jgi:hypothetical protein